MDNNNDMFSNPFDEDEKKSSTPAINDPSMQPMDDGDSGGRPFVWLILGVAAIGCGLIFAAAFFFFQPDAQSLVDKFFPSPTATTTRTPPPTPTLNLTATQKALQSTATAQAIQSTIADANSQWKILLADTFDNNNNQWTTSTDDDYAKIVRTIQDGKYNWDATSKKGFIEWIGIDTKSVSDFSLTVEAQRTTGSLSSDYGLVFREDAKNNFYYFGMDGDGFHAVLNYNNEWIDVVEWTTSDAIRADGPNRLTVIAEGSHFIFLINDQFVANAIDDHIAKGTTGLAIQVFEADLQAVFEFDNVELRIPKPPATPTPGINVTPTITPTAHALFEPPKDVAILEDHFDENVNKWDSYYLNSSVNFRDGKLLLRSTDKNAIGLALCHGCPIYDEAFYFQAEFVLAEDSAIGYGLAFCATGSGNNYHVFQIQSADQTFSLHQNTTDGWKSLVSWEETDLINAYPIPNILAVHFDRGRIDLYINGALAGSYEDQDPPNCRRAGVYVNGGLIDLIVDNVFAYEIK